MKHQIVTRFQRGNGSGHGGQLINCNNSGYDCSNFLPNDINGCTIPHSAMVEHLRALGYTVNGPKKKRSDVPAYWVVRSGSGDAAVYARGTDGGIFMTGHSLTFAHAFSGRDLAMSYATSFAKSYNAKVVPVYRKQK